MKELTRNLKCVVMRNGVEIWKEADRMNDLVEGLMQGQKVGFVRLDDEVVNAADIVGVFNPQTMGEQTKRKNGEYKCEYNKWHKRYEVCECERNYATCQYGTLHKITDICNCKEDGKNNR